jgi:hypothetical protein
MGRESRREIPTKRRAYFRMNPNNIGAQRSDTAVPSIAFPKQSALSFPYSNARSKAISFIPKTCGLTFECAKPSVVHSAGASMRVVAKTRWD